MWSYENIYFYYAKVVTLSSISIIFQHVQYVDTIETIKVLERKKLYC